MSDLLTQTPAPAPEQPITIVGTPLPPPPPAPDDQGPDRRRLLAVISAVALLAAVVMGLLWMSAASARDDAAVERDDARAATVAESDRAEEAVAELAEARTDLDVAATTNEQLATESAAAETAAAEAAARAEAAEAATAELQAQNVELTTEVAALESSLTDAETAAAEAATSAAETAPAAEAPATAAFDIAAAVEFARFLGESLASVEGPTVLGQGQHTCLGTAVVNDIGLDAIGAGLQTDASNGASSALDEAIERGAISCGIDPSAIF